MVDDPVEHQVLAYNAHDVDEFAACYAEGVMVEDAEGTAVMSGRDELRDEYGRMFQRSPDLHVDVVSRIRVGRYVVDEERVSGRPDGDLHAVVVYRLDHDGLIDRVRILR